MLRVCHKILIKREKCGHCRYDSKHRHLVRDSGHALSPSCLCHRHSSSALSPRWCCAVTQAAFCLLQPKAFCLLSPWVVCADFYRYVLGILIRNVALFCPLAQKELIKTVSTRDELFLTLLWSFWPQQRQFNDFRISTIILKLFMLHRGNIRASCCKERAALSFPRVFVCNDLTDPLCRSVRYNVLYLKDGASEMR